MNKLALLLICVTAVFALQRPKNELTKFTKPEILKDANGLPIGDSPLMEKGGLSPGLFDYDDDGDLDLFVGSYDPPKVIYYENIGSVEKPVFKEIGYLKDADGGDISSPNF